MISRMLLAVAAVFVTVTFSLAVVPNETTFDAYLELDGGLVADGQYDVVFRLYDQLEDGTLIWEEAQDTLTVVGGVLQTHFSGLEPGSFKDNPELYLEIEVEDEILSPRTKFRTNPYAFVAVYALSLIHI